MLAQETIIVQINTEPENAQLFIDGKEIDREDVPLFVNVGNHQIEIKQIGYFPFTTNIIVNRKKYRFSYTLKRDESVVIPEHVDTVVVVEEVINKDSSELVDMVMATPKIIPKSDYTFEMEMVDVAGGYFIMGYEYGGKKAKRHTVDLSNFMIGKYEVTQEQWMAIMGENPSKFVNEKYPVENVSWNDVQLFISKLNEETKKKYRLPTEAEWEYAARGGQSKRSNRLKFSGDEDLNNVGWSWRNSGDSILVGRWNLELMKKNNCRTHQVGEKKPNALGIYDMSGNVWEWCSDWCSEGYYNKSPESNPQGPKITKTRVYRGGSFVSKMKQCTVYYRFSSAPKYGYTYLGFRLVLD